MSIPFSTKGDGTFHPVGYDKLTGVPIEVAFMPDGRVVERRVIPEDIVGGVLKANHEDVTETPKGSLIGKKSTPTGVKISSIPKFLYFSLRVKFGNPQHNPKAWARWLRDPDNKRFLTSGYKP